MTDRSTELPAGLTRKTGGVVRLAPMQVAILAVLLAAGGVLEAGRLSALASPDIWRHLSVGNWILNHGSVPRNILFSQSAQVHWVDDTWLFDLLTAAAVKTFGLRGLPLLDMAFSLVIGLAVFLLARGERRGFWSGAVLSAIAMYVIAGRPLLSSVASVLLFAIVLTLMTRSRTAGSQRDLYWLPLIFLLCANLDIQYVYGLMAVVLYLLVEIAKPLVRQSSSSEHDPGSPRMPWITTAVVTVASLAATLCNPYGYRLWGTAVRSISISSVDLYLPEMHSLRFRQPQDYVLLLFVMTAYFAVGRRHARDLYSLLLLTVCSIVSFHLQRDAWLAAIAAVAVLTHALDATSSEAHNVSASTAPWVVPVAALGATVVLLAAFVLRVPASRDTLMAKVSEGFPVRACDYIRRQALPNPIFNSYDWGSFLTWYLPEYPVSIDGRADAYGEETTLEYFKVTTGQVPLSADPALSGAATILLAADSEMGKALSILPGYRQVYFDDEAMVLVRQN